jgi:hypothetical protein
VFHVVAEKLSFPEILTISELMGGSPEITANGVQRTFIKSGRTSGSRYIFQTRKAAPFKAFHPVLYSTRAVPKKFCNLITTESSTYQQDSMKSMVIAGYLRSYNLLLYSNSHDVLVFDFKFAHSSLLSS